MGSSGCRSLSGAECTVLTRAGRFPSPSVFADFLKVIELQRKAAARQEDDSDTSERPLPRNIHSSIIVATLETHTRGRHPTQDEPRNELAPPFATRS